MVPQLVPPLFHLFHFFKVSFFPWFHFRWNCSTIGGTMIIVIYLIIISSCAHGSTCSTIFVNIHNKYFIYPGMTTQ